MSEREKFEQWFIANCEASYMPNDLIKIIEASWQACSAEKDKEIALRDLEIVKLRAALKFYSDCNHFNNRSDGKEEITDYGEVADEALTKLRGG